MKKYIIKFFEKYVVNLMWFFIINVAYFFFVGMEECVWIKDNKICKTFSSLIIEISKVICIFIVCVVYYGKEIKYKKLKVLLWIVACAIVEICCESFIPEKIEMVFNYYVYIIVHLLLIGVCITYMRKKE